MIIKSVRLIVSCHSEYVYQQVQTCWSHTQLTNNTSFLCSSSCKSLFGKYFKLKLNRHKIFVLLNIALFVYVSHIYFSLYCKVPIMVAISCYYHMPKFPYLAWQYLKHG